MAKKTTIKEVVVEVPTETEAKPSVSLLTQEFGNGDLNVLRDKINEIIEKVNG